MRNSNSNFAQQIVVEFKIFKKDKKKEKMKEKNRPIILVSCK